MVTATKRSRTPRNNGTSSKTNNNGQRPPPAEIEVFHRKGWLSRQFDRIAEKSARLLGSPAYFLACVLTVFIWAGWGLPAAFSDTWQLVMNTLTTVLTWIMVALLQASQNRATAGLHAKLDEIVRVLPSARDELVGAGEETEP